MAIGTPIVLGSTNAASPSSNSLVLTTGADSPSNNSIILFVAQVQTPGAALSTASDSNSNSYTVNGETAQNAFLFAQTAMSLNTTMDLASGQTITAVFAQPGINPGTDQTLIGTTLSGINQKDVDTGAQGVSPGAAPSLSTGTLASSSEIIFAFIAYKAVATLTEASGWTSLTTYSTGFNYHIAYQIVSSTTSVTYNPSLSASTDWVLRLISFKAGGNTNQSASAANAQTVKQLKRPQKLLSIINTEGFNITKAVARAFSVFDAQVVLPSRGFFRQYSTRDAQGIMVDLAIPRDISIFTAENINNLNATLKVIQTNLLQVINLTKSLSKLVGLVQAQVIAAVRTTLHYLSLMISNPETIKDQKSVLKLLSTALNETVFAAAIKRAAKVIQVASSEVIGALKSTGKILSVTQAQVVSFISNAIKLVNTISTQTVNLLKTVTRILKVISPESISALPYKGSTVAINTLNASSVFIVKSINSLVSIAEPQAINLLNAITRFVSIASTEIIRNLNSVSRAINVVVLQAINIGKSVSWLVSVSQAQFVRITRLLPFHVSILNPETAHQFNQEVTLQSAHANQAQSVSFVPNIFYLVSVSSAQVVNFGRAVTRNIQIASTQFIGVLFGAGRAIGASTSQIANVFPQFAHEISVLQAQSINLLTSFYHRRRMAIWMRKQNRFN